MELILGEKIRPSSENLVALYEEAVEKLHAWIPRSSMENDAL